jgi:hypothetical protein
MENRKSKRSVRLALVLGAAAAGTALVGFGGLAAWQAYTQNSGNAFSVGTLAHTNVVTGTGVTCNSTKSSAQASLTPCSIIVTGNILTSTWAGSAGTVTIQNTGQLPATFEVSSPPSDPPTGALCADLNLTVTGTDSVTPYISQSGIGLLGLTSLNTSAGGSSWAPGASNAFTFAVTPASGFSTNNSIPGESCSFDVLFTQASA